MNDYRRSLRTVGMALIALGVFDFAWDAYRMAGRGFALGLGTFAIIPGIILYWGSLLFARVAAFFAAFLVIGYLAFLLVAPFALRIPLDLGLTYLRLRPLAVAQGALWMIGPAILSAWVYRRLTAPVMLAAMAEEGIGYKRLWQKPASGFIAGAALMIVLTVLYLTLDHPLMMGATVARAKIEARKKVGSGHEFFVSSWMRQYGPRGRASVRALVIAYNRHEIQDMKVTWDE